MLGTRNDQLSDLLGTSIAALDIPDHLAQLAVRRYQDVGEWLSERYWSNGGAGCDVYPQGSFRLGTVVSPVDPRGEYDVDLVCRRNISKDSTSQADLKADVGKGLVAFTMSGAEGDPGLNERKRCWTLGYPHDRFHMDVLPAVPDEDGVANAILLTDRELRNWQSSNPIDYAAWFHERMRREFDEVRRVLAKDIDADIEQVPAWRVKTVLQRAVQALKRHRDLHFAENRDELPASILITTLAAQSYAGGGPLYEVLLGVLRKMPSFIEDIDGVWWVANPVQPKENFADGWRSHPRQASAFFRWLEAAEADFASLGSEAGMDTVINRLAKSLGDQAARAAGGGFGSALSGARDRGSLRSSAGTLLIGGAARAVPKHTFHGEPPRTPRP